MKIEIFPRAEADLIRQVPLLLVEQDAPAAAFRFREAVKESLERIKLIRAWVGCFEGRFLAFVHGR